MMARSSRPRHRARPLALALAGAILALVGAASAQPRFVSIGTASPAGAYYPLGVAMAEIWNDTIPGTTFSAQETGGSVANMNLLAAGDIELGIANENIGFDAYNGADPFASPLTDMSMGWTLNASQGVFVSLASSGITDVAQLAGRRVGMGAPGSSGNVLAQRVLAAQGIDEGEYTPVFLGWQESAEALVDGALDAAIMVGGQPFPAIESLAIRQDVHILRFDDAALNPEGAYPLTKRPLPADMYDTPFAGDAIVVRSIVYLRNDLPEDTAYAMVAAVFDNVDALAEAHPTGNQAELISSDLADLLRIPVHPGIVRYAQEKGAW
jgi:TRAP transporter TAXI family solute receptor